MRAALHRNVAAGLALSVLAIVLGIGSARAAPSIEWRVENPFRFFTDAGDTEVHRQTYLSLSGSEREHPVLNAERALSARHPGGWAATMFTRTCWDRESNAYACPSRTDYLEPESHTVVASIKGVADAALIGCTWLTAPRRGANRNRGSAVARRCSDPVRLDIPYREGATVTVQIGHAAVAETVIEVEDVLVAGMGDSFGSGEGNPDVAVRFSRERSIDYADPVDAVELAGFPARVGAWRDIGDKAFISENALWLDQACHRSLYSHQLRTALQLSLENPHRAVTFVGLACSGAEITRGLFLRYKGHEWVPNPPPLSHISALADAQCGGSGAPSIDLPEAYHLQGEIASLKGGLVLKRCPSERARKIDLLLVSIGGNDIGFARLVANAVLQDGSTLRQLGGWFGQVHGRQEALEQLRSLSNRYKALNRAIHSILHVPWSESDRIVLTAYPGMAVLDDGRSVCPDGRAGMEVLSDFALSRSKAREGTDVADRLHRIMRESALAHGWSLAETHREAFRGRGICAGFAASAFSIADDLRLPRRFDGKWVPYNPAAYEPYVSRQRWFRTPNDAFMTAHIHIAGSVLQQALNLESLSHLQVLIAATYSGAFHPTAEGQAAIADAAVVKARAVLEKYSGRNRIK